MGIKISELTAVTSIAGTEEIPVVQSSTTKKATASQLKGYRSFVGLLGWDPINEDTDLTTLQNDGFNLVFNKTDIGKFSLEDTSGPFLINKTALFIMQDNNVGNGGNGLVHNYFYRYTDEILKIDVYDEDPTDIQPTDLLTKVSIEIRVYP